MEWSCFEDFMPLAGESIVENMRHLEYEIDGLAKGNRYYVRVAAWNMKGYSPYTAAKPSYAVPSSKILRACHLKKNITVYERPSTSYTIVQKYPVTKR